MIIEKCWKLPRSHGRWVEGKGRKMKIEQKFDCSSCCVGESRIWGLGVNKVWGMVKMETMVGFEGWSKMVVTVLSLRIRLLITESEKTILFCFYQNIKFRTRRRERQTRVLLWLMIFLQPLTMIRDQVCLVQI